MNNQNPYQVITGARVIDGTGAPALERAAVLLDGARVRWVGPAAELRVPDGAQAQTYHYPDATVLPGLVDVHTHMNLPGDGTLVEETAAEPEAILLLRSVMNGRNHLESGVTTARENGAKEKTAFALKDGIERGFVSGPRMVVCGRPITISGGHCWFFGGVADGVVGVRQAVRRLIKEGADYIKVMVTGGGTLTSNPHLPSYTLAELQAIADEAHCNGKPVAMHATATQGIVNALDAGADMLVHCNFYQPDGSYRYDPEVAERIAEQGVWVNPTLHVARSRIWLAEAQQRAGTLSPQGAQTLDRNKADYEKRQDGCRRLMELGAKVVAGSDGGWGVYPLGQFQHEITALAGAGMRNADCILASTREAAASIGMDRLVGTLEPGKAADVVVVDGNPLDDIDALNRVRAVFKAGVQHV